MKKQLPLLFVIGFILFSAQFLNAQRTNLIFFSEQGERFSIILNGILQNPVPETNVKITDLPAPSYKAKIIFEDKNLPEIDKNLMFGKGTETTFCIRKNNKGEYVVRFMSQIDIEQAPPPSPAQKIYVYTTVPAVTSTTVTQINTSTTMTGGVTIGGTSVMTTTTTQTTSETPQQGSVKGKPVYEMPGYSGPVGCPYPLSDLDFQDVKNSIAAKSFESSKLTIAKEVISANCLFASEVKQVMKLFDFESSRLEFAKYAYKFTFDQGNYYKLNDAFQFESSINELKEYIRKQK